MSSIDSTMDAESPDFHLPLGETYIENVLRHQKERKILDVRFSDFMKEEVARHSKDVV